MPQAEKKGGKNSEELERVKQMTDSMSEDLVSLGHVFDTFLRTGENSTKDVLKKFVALVMKGDKEILKEKAKDHVRLSTIHQAKGLEWDYVWLVRFNEKMIPTTYQGEEGESQEEYAHNSKKHTKVSKELMHNTHPSFQLYGACITRTRTPVNLQQERR